MIGLESVSPAGLGAVDPLRFKSRYVESYREKIAAIQDSGIGVYGTFIVGLDQDDKGIFEATSRFILENRLYGANVTPYRRRCLVRSCAFSWKGRGEYSAMTGPFIRSGMW